MFHRASISFTRALQVLGIFVGALSIVLLVRLSIMSSGFEAPLQLIIDYYDHLIGIALSWLEPHINSYLLSLGIQMEVEPHWKHVFVLMWVYFLRDAATTWEARNFGSAIFLLLMGLVLAAAASMGAGLIPLDKGNILTSLTIAIAPVVGVLIYDFANLIWYSTWLREKAAARDNLPTEKWLNFITTRLRLPVWRASFAIVFILIALQFTWVRNLPNPGVFLLLLLVTFLAVYWLNAGAKKIAKIGHDNESWMSAYLRTGSAQLGLSMIVTIGAAALFVASNAGLQLVGP